MYMLQYKNDSKRNVPMCCVLIVTLLAVIISSSSHSKNIGTYTSQDCVSNGSNICSQNVQYVLVKNDRKIQQLIEQLKQICSDCHVLRISRKKFEMVLRKIEIPEAKWSGRVPPRIGIPGQQVPSPRAGIPPKKCRECEKCPSTGNSQFRLKH